MSEKFSIQVEGNNINGQLFVPDVKFPYPTIIICHGIPGGPPDPGDKGYPLLAERFCAEGYCVIIFNFRGSGESGGNLDIMGWTRDLRAVVEYTLNLIEVDKDRLALLGFSAGAATAVYAASHDARINVIALCACPADFNSIISAPDIFLNQLKNVGAIRDKDFPPSIEKWLDGFKKVNSLECINWLTSRQLLILHGNSDEVVPVDDARRLYLRAGEPKTLKIIEGAGHRLRRNEKAMTAVIDWFNSIFRTDTLPR